MSLVEKSVEGGYFVVPAYTPTSSEATKGRYLDGLGYSVYHYSYALRCLCPIPFDIRPMYKK